MDATLYREAMSRWASGVSVVACRHDGRIIATTVSALLSLSLAPPLVLMALGHNATVLPFLTGEARFGISVLTAAQRRLAAVFADPFPVGDAPLPAGDVPVLPESLIRLNCHVQETRVVGDHTVLIAAVDDAHFADGPPLIRYRRRYHALAPA